MKHIEAYIPEPLKAAARLAAQVKYTSGQKHYELTRTICRLLREGTKS